jgi:hypothetical protein
MKRFATARVTATGICTLNMRKIATRHTASKTPRTFNRRATRRSREEGAIHGIMTRSLMTRIAKSLALQP